MTLVPVKTCWPWFTCFEGHDQESQQPRSIEFNIYFSKSQFLMKIISMENSLSIFPNFVNRRNPFVAVASKKIRFKFPIGGQSHVYEKMSDMSIFKEKNNCTNTTAEEGGGSFKNWKPTGVVGCCEPRMAEQRHWWIDRCFMFRFFLSLSCPFSDYLLAYPTRYRSIYISFKLSIFLAI